MLAETALITGGAGFIGARLALALSPRVERVVVFDNLHPQVHGSDAAPPDLPANCVFIRGDVADADAVVNAVEKHNPSLLYHLAAETGTGQSFDEPARYTRVNVLGAAHVVEALRRLKGNRPRCVLASSRAVYGEGAYQTGESQIVAAPPRRTEDMARGEFDPIGSDGRRMRPVPSPETLPPSPSSVYASTKLMQEYILEQCAADGNIQPVILRFQNVYGPGQSLRNPYTGVLSIFASQILQGRPLEIYEDGQIARDFVFVDDVVEALIAAADAPAASSGPINIGAGSAATILDAARTLLRLLGAPQDNLSISGKFRPGDIRHAAADIRRAREVLSWRPRVSLEKGLSQLASWAKHKFESEGVL